MNEDTIDLEQLEHLRLGLFSILEHTDQLLKDSELLIRKKRYSASIPLSIIAIEEIGKSYFLESVIKSRKPVFDKIWDEITKGGGAHIKKTTSLILARKLYLDNITPEQNSDVDKMMKELGMEVTDTKQIKIENMLLKATFLRLENLKHDCLYINREKNKKWINFTNRFKTYEQSAIANYLYIVALRLQTTNKFILKMPPKPFKEYSKNEIKNQKNLWKKEVKPIMKKTDSKRLSRLTDHGMLFLHNNYHPDRKRGLVTEKDDGWLELNF